MIMSPENNIPVKNPSKDDSQSSGSRKTASARPPEQSLNCPRCDSPNTKFCYYNNYSLTQPRHFCKTCRRYWTKGGALRNVPIGGGCRKNKKMKSSSSSRLSGGSDSKDSGCGSGVIGGGLNLKFFQGLSPPAMDFQLGAPLSFPRLGGYNQFSSFGDISTNTSGATPSAPCFGVDSLGNSNFPMGINFPFSSTIVKQGESGGGFGGVHDMGPGSLGVHGNNIVSSIESLSSINQDLHWKLQQQRLAVLFGEENPKEPGSSSSSLLEINGAQKLQPILFQNLEISKPDASFELGNNNSRKEGASANNNTIATEWFFNSSNYHAPVNPSQSSSAAAGNGNESTTNWMNNGTAQAWTHDLNQYSALP